MKVLSIIGTRPEAIKMAPVIRELGRHAGRITSRVCVTAQHRHMLDQVLSLFDIVPDHDLDLMRERQSPTRVAASVLARLEPILAQEKPDWVLVQGDTTTAMAAAIGAFYAGVKVGHVEAGLRTFDKYQPFPEEVNRKVVCGVADLHFAPTLESRANLLREGVADGSVIVTGNSVIDALHAAARLPYHYDAGPDRVGPLTGIPWDKRIVLITAHRRENLGAPMETICRALRTLAERYAKDVHLVYPVHLNPGVQEPVRRWLSDRPNITLLEPLDYLSLVQVMKRCTLVLTDSGGLQEEAPSLGKPVLVLRHTTERPEAARAGTVKLIGPVFDAIVEETSRLLEDADAYERMARAVNPYGDGLASGRIVGALAPALKAHYADLPEWPPSAARQEEEWQAQEWQTREPPAQALPFEGV